ncbi:acidic mammalian chitinase-like [Discoglossus pictus]
MQQMLLFGGLVLILHLQPGSVFKLNCYFRSWAEHLPEHKRFSPKNIDPHLCTHITFQYATMKDHVIMATDKNDEVLYKELASLKEKNKKLVTLLAIGGLRLEMRKFTKMAAYDDKRKIFIDSIIAFLRLYEFDGIDLQFMYPGHQGSQPQDKQRFTKLCQEAYASFKAESLAVARPRLRLIATVSSLKEIIDGGYELDLISKVLDFVSVFTYHMFEEGAQVARHHSPLCQGTKDVGDDAFLNIVREPSCLIVSPKSWSEWWVLGKSLTTTELGDVHTYFLFLSPGPRPSETMRFLPLPLTGGAGSRGASNCGDCVAAVAGGIGMVLLRESVNNGEGTGSGYGDVGTGDGVVGTGVVTGNVDAVAHGVGPVCWGKNGCDIDSCDNSWGNNG